MIVTFNSKSQKNKKEKVPDTQHDSFLSSSSSSTTTTTTSNHKILKPTSNHSQSKNIKLINGSKDFYKFKDGRSRNGCLTCKVRKKKCSEEKPTCNDCQRFGKKCIYVDETMTDMQIKALKKEVEIQESTQKLRKRKPRSRKQETPTESSNDPAQSNTIPVTPPTTQIGSSESLISSSKSPDHVDPLGAFAYNSNLRSTSNPGSPFGGFSPNSPTIQNLINHNDPQNNEEDKDDDKEDDKVEDIVPSLEEQDVVSLSPKSPLQIDRTTPAAFINFLRDLNALHQDDSNKIEELNEVESPELHDLVTSPDFNSMLESFENSTQLLHSPNLSYNELVSNLNAFLHPQSQIPPSPTYIPELIDPTCSYLYNYYADVLSKKISIAPISQNDSNSYQKVFLPLAHKDKGVLYAILAWSGFHLGGHWSDEGVKYLEYALDHLNKTALDKPGGYDRQNTLNKLATLMILCAAEICKGDVKNWSIYLHWGWKLLASNGGILNFNQSKEEHWLISNFAYHDLLASSSIERGTYFPSEQDDQGFSMGSLNPLLGISKNLYRIIGDISTLLYESRKKLDEFYSREFKGSPSEDGTTTEQDEQENNNNDDDDDDGESEISDHGRASNVLTSVISKVKQLEKEIDDSKPATKDLINLTDQELELQLTLFEAFQLSAKLFLRQSIMKCNPSMLESQVLNNDLVKCLDILVGTSVQASLVFPIFISGIHCVSKYDQESMRHRINKFIKLYGLWNVSRISFVLHKIWKENPDGSKVVDWHNSLKELGWDINFA
ncbi:UGA3 Transcriptional activator protein UGA3 [Candida maltosa Xu316]